MKLFSINSPLLLRAWLLIGMLWSLSRPAVQAARHLQVPAAADSAVVVRVDSATTVTLSDSLVRELALKIGMIDASELQQRAEMMGRTDLDTAQTVHLTRYERRRMRAIRGWAKLIPNQATLQYAGSIGIFSVGLGWHYGHNHHWETDLLLGIVPRYHSEHAKTTFTIKQRYVPWHCNLSSRWTLQPLTTGIFFSTISGDDFWKNQPDRYPKNYYGFSTKVRTNVFIGQRLRYNIPRSKRILHQAVSIYYELSTCDLYLVSKAVNKDFPWKDTFSLAFGLRWEM